MDGTRRYGDDAVRALGIEPDDVLIPPPPDGELQFIAVGVLLFAALAGRDGYVDAADFAERLFDDARFEPELRTVLDVLELTAAAARKNGALGSHALLRGREDLLDLGVCDAALDFEHLDFGALSRQETGHEERRAAVAHDALALRAERLAGDDDFFVLFHVFLPPKIIIPHLNADMVCRDPPGGIIF